MKSSFSYEGECVSVEKEGDNIVVVLHSKSGLMERAGSPRFTLSEWDAFIRGVKNGEFDLDKL